MNKIKSTKSNEIFNVEKVKNNKLPVHFLSSESRNMSIDGQKVKVMINRERSQYVAFQIDGQSYYVRNHKFFDSTEKFESYVKPVSEKSKQPTMKAMIEAAKQAGIDLAALVSQQTQTS